jgi:hypothetical protein
VIPVTTVEEAIQLALVATAEADTETEEDVVTPFGIQVQTEEMAPSSISM